MTDIQFKADMVERAAQFAKDETLQSTAHNFLQVSSAAMYPYNFHWLGRPIIQYPQDIVAMQEVMWNVQPTVVIETGVARGGSLIFYASMLRLLSMCAGQEPSNRRVIGVDIDIRQHNREGIEAHPLGGDIQLIQGSSTDPAVLDQVKAALKPDDRVLVVLDSNHTHDHVYDELKAYCDLVSPGSYLVVFDTLIEDMPEDHYPDRSWGPGNSPKSALKAFLQENDAFTVDEEISNRLLISVANGGFLLKTS